MASDKQLDETQEQSAPTNGGVQRSVEPDDGLQDEPNRKLRLAVELEWLRPLFGMPVTVQTVDPLWQVRPKAAMLVEVPGAKGESQIGTLGLPELVRDDKGEPVAIDVFENAQIEPTRSGTHVVIMQSMELGPERGTGQALYTVAAAQIRSVAQVAPSEPQVRSEMERIQGRHIMVPGSPTGEGGKLIV